MTPSPRTVQEITDYLLSRNPLPPLVPECVFDDALTEEIEAVAQSAALKVGLYVLNDDLAAGHALAQRLEGDPLADYWHAIIHRREGDYGNARYWFGHVTSEPILVQVYGTDPNAPNAFVERCRAVGQGRNADLEEFQRDEIARLLAYTQERSA